MLWYYMCMYTHTGVVVDWSVINLVTVVGKRNSERVRRKSHKASILDLKHSVSKQEMQSGMRVESIMLPEFGNLDLQVHTVAVKYLCIIVFFCACLEVLSQVPISITGLFHFVCLPGYSIIHILGMTMHWSTL